MGQYLSQQSADQIQRLSAGSLEVKSFTLKRLLDALLTIWALPVLLPVMLFVAIIIKFDSPGPVIFAQKRVGLRSGRDDDPAGERGTIFTLYKFRTMHVDTDTEIHRKFMQAYISADKAKMTSLQPEAEQSKAYKLNNDPRVTRVGKYLRKLSLDELPQIMNVIKGEMSLVGPRPAIPYEVEMYAPEHLRRLDTLPGITGLWQVSGRTTTTFEEMIRLDVEYIEKQSIWLDLKILFLTVPAVISKKGAG